MNFYIHTVFLDVYPRVIYSASVIDVEMVFCFLLYQDTTTLFKKKHYLIIDFWSLMFLANLLSTNLIRSYSGKFLGWQLLNPWPNIRSKSIIL